MGHDFMNDAREETLGEPERRASQNVRELPAAIADPDFRARLAADFASGRIEASPRRAAVIRLPWHRREMTRWAVAAAAAAALVVAALAVNQGPEWRVVSRHGGGLASVDGREVALTDGAMLDRMIRAGVQVAMPQGGDLVLQAGEQMMLALDPGSVVTLPGTAGRWFGRRLAGRVDAGVMRISTGASFHGAALALRTPEAQVHVTGTTFAVICEPAGTCVCVLEGVVQVGPLGAAMSDIPGGMRGYVYASGAPMVRATMRPDEHEKLGALRARRDERMGAAGR